MTMISASVHPSFYARVSLSLQNSFKNWSITGKLFAVLSKKEKRKFIAFSVVDVLVNIVDILSLALLLTIIQYYVAPGAFGSARSFQPLLQGHEGIIITVFFVLFAGKNISAFIVSSAQARFTAAISVKIAGESLKAYQQLSYQDFISLDSSVHVRRIAYLPLDYCHYLLMGTQQLITQGSLIFITISAVLLYDAGLFLLLMVVLVPPATIVFYLLKKKLTKARAGIKRAGERSFQFLMDALKGYVEGNIYNRNLFFQQRFLKERAEFSSHVFHSVSIQTLPARLIEIFAVLGFFLLIAVAGMTGNKDSISLVTIGAFVAAAFKTIPGVVRIVNTTSQMKAYRFSSDELPVTQHQQKDLQQEGVIASIHLENVCFRYDQRPLLEQITLHLKTGDFVGITGRSGSGKTTLLHLLLGFVSPFPGRIVFNGPSDKASDLKKFWPRISYVRQQPFFLFDTVRKNITLQEEPHDEARLKWSIEHAGLEPLLAEDPEGYDKIITENGKNISGGQQQRVMLARALYRDADLILLDEPFNELDEASEHSLLQFFKTLTARGKIVLMVTHNNRALSWCNKIVSLDEQ